MYAFRVSPHVENLIKECAARLITLGVPVSQSVFFFECGGSSRFGYCKKGDAKGASGFEYSIAINKYIVNDKDISNTVAHELLHTIKTAKNHDCPIFPVGVVVFRGFYRVQKFVRDGV